MSTPDLIASLERTVVRLVQAPDAETAMHLALAYLLDAAGADMGAVFAPAGSSLRFVTGHGLPPKFLRKPPLLERSAWEGGMLVKHPGGEPVDEALEEAGRLAGVQTWATLPIAYRDGFFGLLLVASRDLVGFSHKAVELFSILSRVLGLALYGLRHAPRTPGLPAEGTVSEPPPTRD